MKDLKIRNTIRTVFFFCALLLSLAAVASAQPQKGIGTVNSDCTGTATFSVYDESGTTLLRTATFSVVFVDNAREEREIATSLVLEPTGTHVPTVISGSAKKLFPGRGNEHEE